MELSWQSGRGGGKTKCKVGGKCGLLEGLKGATQSSRSHRGCWDPDHIGLLGPQDKGQWGAMEIWLKKPENFVIVVKICITLNYHF